MMVRCAVSLGPQIDLETWVMMTDDRPHELKAPIPRPWKRRLVLAAGLWLSIPLFQVGAWSAPTTPFVLGTDQAETSFFGKFYRSVYGEAFKRLDIPVEFVVYPTQRLSIALDQGAIDGEVARARGYATAHPDLVRVDESVFETAFALYGANPALVVKRLDDLRSTRLQGRYRRGVLFCEKALKPLLPAEQLADVSTTAQGLGMLLAGRADVYCDVDAAVLQELYSEEFKGGSAIRKLLELEAAPLYPYLHRKRAELAPPLGATLKQMKAEGLIERYRRDAERESRPK